MITAVLDTNVLISGTFWLGPPKELLSFCVSLAAAKRIEADLLSYTSLVRPRAHVTICHDAADNRVLECALETVADYVVTGDPHLLDIGQYRGVKIVTVRAFLDALQEPEG